MVRSAVASLSVLLAFTTGCVGTLPGGVIAEHYTNNEADTTNVSYQATYVLVREGAQPEKPLQQFELHWHDRIGFEWDNDGQLYAVACYEKYPLEDGHYCWRVTPETERVGLERALLVTKGNLLDAEMISLDLLQNVLLLPFIFLMTPPH